MSSHSGPTLGICTTWSITEMAVEARLLGGRAEAPQVVGELRAPRRANSKRPRWSVKRRGTGSSRWARALAGAVRKRGGTSATGSSPVRWWTASKPSVGERVDGGGERAELRGDDLRRHRVAARLVASPRLALRHVEHHGVRRTAAPPRHGEPRGAAVGLEPGGVDDGREAAPQARVDDLVEHREGVLRRALVALVQPDHARAARPTTPPAFGAKWRGRPRRLPAAGHARRARRGTGPAVGAARDRPSRAPRLRTRLTRGR